MNDFKKLFESEDPQKFIDGMMREKIKQDIKEKLKPKNLIFKALAFGITWLVMFAIMYPVLVLYSSFVIFKLYMWFGVTAGLPVLSYWHIYGLCMIGKYVSFQGTRTPKKQAWGKDIYIGIIHPLIILLTGWVIKSYLI